jgi:RNA polymerase sigma-70 factor (ECF subfamily)
MQNVHAYIQNGQCLEVLNGKEAAQELRSTLSTRLPALYRTAYRLLGNAADAEDAVQDALLAAHKHLDQFQGRSQMSTWLAAIVQNSARMQLRLRLRHVHVSLDEPLGVDMECSVSDRLADEGPTPEDNCRTAELNNYVRRLKTQLSPTLLRTFHLRDIEGLSTRETAEILGIPNGTVKAQLARARRKLRQLMGKALTPRSRNLTAVYGQKLAA